MELPLEKKFKIQSAILRATYFEWRRAALSFCPGVNPMAMVLKYWEEVGHDSAEAYLRQIDPGRPLPPQLAQQMVFSSVCMGEEARFAEGGDEKEAFVYHDSCPWYDWHKRLGLEDEDQDGCDHWIRTFVQQINNRLGTKVNWETQKSLAAGDEVCLRRFWVD